MTEMLVESTFDHLKEKYEENDKQAISYFALILDPTSFSKSVENMFHFSFLVKEGRASFELDEEGKGLPYTRPLKAKHHVVGGNPDEEVNEKRQAIISLTFEDWEDMIQLLDIEEPMIKHDLEYLSNRKDSSKRAKH